MDPVPKSRVQHLFPLLLTHLVAVTTVFLATSTLIVTSWIFVTGRGDFQSHTHSSPCTQLFAPPPSLDSEINVSHIFQIHSCSEFLFKFRPFFTCVAGICGVASFLQLVVTIYLLPGSGTEELSSQRGSWRWVHIASNLVYVLTFLAIKTYPVPPSLGGREELFARIQYLPGFQILLLTNIILGSCLLIFVSLMRGMANKGGVGGAGGRLKYSSLLVQHHL